MCFNPDYVISYRKKKSCFFGLKCVLHLTNLYLFPMLSVGQQPTKISRLLHYSYRLDLSCIEGIILKKKNMVRRIFRFDEASLNSSSSSSNIASPSSSSSFGTSSTGILNPTNQSTTTIGDFSLRSSSTQVDGSVSSLSLIHI